MSCCIVGGGPAGLMTGYLLARAGVDVAVLEKHPDFLRDFRGDTLHPSTLEVMHELGLLERLLRLPHQKVRKLGGTLYGRHVEIADFSHVPTHARFIALMPQWDFLSFIAQQGEKLPGFRLYMGAEASDLIEQSGRFAGVQVRTKRGSTRVLAKLTIAADGRSSLLRERAELPSIDLGAPMDVLWLRLPRRPEDPEQTGGHVTPGQILVLLNRDDYWQCAVVIRKGTYDLWRRGDISELQQRIARVAPFLEGRVGSLRSWEDVKLLEVRVDRLKRWVRPGLLCIGDAAHAMSPVGGAGINLAIQDAVATANLLGEALRGPEPPTLLQLRKVQRRRELATLLTQKLQVAVQKRLIGHALSGSDEMPPVARLLDALPLLRRIPGRLVGVGVLPEHVEARRSRHPTESSDAEASRFGQRGVSH